jgi:predicted transcriptional regulator
MEVGTQLDNINDTQKRDRIKFGSRHHSAKLSETDVKKIVFMRGTVSQKELARTYGVNPSVISRIYSGRAWARAA